MIPGFWELVLIAVIVFLIFGAGRLPRLMGDLAQGIKSFKQGMKDDASSPPPSNNDEKKN